MSVAEVVNAEEAFYADPTQAQIRFRAHHDLTGPTEVTVRVGSGHRFTVDEPKTLGGGDTAPNPVEYALAALGSCQAITYRVWANKLGVKLDKVDVEIEGDIDLRGFLGVDDQVRPGFNAVRIRVHLTGPDSPSRYKELAEVVDAHCPVLDVFRNPVPVERELTLPH
jgi:uncharacterized OsmC-like protein